MDFDFFPSTQPNPVLGSTESSFVFESQPSIVLESQIETPTEVENRKKTRKCNYSIEEDVALVRAWLHISEDAVVGRDQKSTKLWERVLDKFHQFLGKTTDRNGQGIQNRWQLISHDVSKFCGHYNKIGRLNPSGWNDQMKFEEAKKQFGEIEGPLQQRPLNFYRFKFEHCWKLLKDSSKWTDYVLVRNSTKAPKKQLKPISIISDVNTSNTPLSSTIMTNDIVDEDVSQSTTLNSRRPEGRRQVKAKRKKEAQEDESTLYLKSINQTLKEAATIEREKWEAKKKRSNEKALNQEMKVMSQSMVGLTPEQEAYWKLQQSMIIERYKESGRLSSLERNNVSGSDFDLNEF